MRVLVVNAGSSSLKLSLLDAGDRTLACEELSAPHAEPDEHELDAALRAGLGEADAVGHRIVHGGERFHEAVRIDAGVEHELRELTSLAPLHQPKSLAALDAVAERLPGVPAVACFDTAFHATLPAAASTYALPAKWRERLGVRRYGFHGLSHGWIARRVPELLEEAGGAPEPSSARRGRAGLRTVSCHLGAGASLCAIRDGVSLDTTMGFTPLEGLVMATRSGSVDPGALLWLLQRGEADAEELAHALEHRSGLLALAGTADMRELLARAGAGEHAAGLAAEVYVHRLRAGIAAMAAALGGLDALAFTGGAGERSAELRARACAGLGFLGVALDEERNRTAAPDAVVSPRDGAVAVLAIAAREDLEIARQTRGVLGESRA